MPTQGSNSEELAFSVDTHLFRELGSLLVGRDSTALVELIKNAYDADARRVVVHAEQLGSRTGHISVSDDGIGMSYETFVNTFLRIAGRSKERGSRRSPNFGRRYTGAKGIGRLSAYKLAENLRVTSVPVVGDGINASIDWQALEASEGDVQDNKLVQALRTSSPVGPSGTALTLTGLKFDLAKGRLPRFLREIRATRPDPALYRSNPERALGVSLLIPEIDVADADGTPFILELSGDLDPGDPPWASVMEAIDWVIEVDARATVVHYRISPTANRVRKQVAARVREFSYDRPTDGPRFAARILVRSARSAGYRLDTVVDKFIKEISGVRVYMEGFQVLPYGLAGNDWLEVDRDAVRRNALIYNDASLPEDPETDERTYQLSTQNYIGAVFLHEETSPGLEMVVNREGFLPTPALEQVRDIVRRGIDLTVRVRAALGAIEKEEKATERAKKQQELIASVNQTPSTHRSDRAAPESPSERIFSLVDIATQAAAGLRTSAGGAQSSQPAVELVQAALEQARTIVEDVRDEQAQLRVLASVGTQFGAFIHEVNALLAQAKVVLRLLDQLVESTVDRDLQKQSRNARIAMAELVASLERQAIYLTDTIGAEARRRRSRQKLHERLATARRLLSPVAASRGVEIIDEVGPSIRTPAMFPAEINVVLTNLLSNAIKAAGRSGSIRVSADERTNELVIRIENTGVAVSLEDRERWFRPFETTTSEVDEILGQGMGLGLPLTRRVVEEYGGTVHFVEPRGDYATAVEVSLPRGR